MNRVSNYVTFVTTIFLTVSLAKGLRLDVKLKRHVFQAGDGSVQLTCYHGNQTKTRLHETARMRLMRLDNDRHDGDGNSTKTWTNVAVLHYDQSIQTVDGNITASGYSGDVFESFLTITWPVTLEHLFGRYRCDAVGYTQTLDDIVTDESPIADVRDTSQQQQSLQLYKLIQDSERKMMTQVQNMMRGVVNSSISNILNGLKSKDVYEENQETTTTTAQSNDTDSETAPDDSHLWPDGNFTLLMPDTGCPVDPPLWKEGLLEMKVENNRKYYPVNSPLHLASPHTREGFVYKQVCSLFESSDRKRAWPEGSYCIQTFTLPCPDGFKLSVSKFDGQTQDENNNIVLHWNGKPEVDFHTSNFCCRHDGSHEDPITLPSSKPFYLYIHKGACQKVKDMHVTQDLFMMATVKDSGGDLWLSGDADYLPDVSMGPVKEELCYYF